MADTRDDWQAWFDRHGPALVLLARAWVPTRADALIAVIVANQTASQYRPNQALTKPRSKAREVWLIATYGTR